MKSIVGGILEDFTLPSTERIIKKLLDDFRPDIYVGLSTMILSIVDRKSQNLIIKWHTKSPDVTFMKNVEGYFNGTPIPRDKSKMWEILEIYLNDKTIEGVERKNNCYISYDPVTKNQKFIPTLQEGIKASFYLPLHLNENEIMGIFAIDSTLKERFPDKLDLLYSLGKFLETTSVALYKAYYDILTGKLGIFNMGYFQALLEELVIINNRDLYLCFIDLNEFKKVNDEHSHQIGDKVLKHFGSLLYKQKAIYEKNTGFKGWLFRRGGDEFILLLEGKNYDSIFNFLSDSVDKEIEGNPYEDGGLNILLSGACGIASLKDLLEEGDRDVKKIFVDLESHADRVMYFSKQLVKKGILKKNPGLIVTPYDKASQYVKKIEECSKEIENMYRCYLQANKTIYSKKYLLDKGV